MRKFISFVSLIAAVNAAAQTPPPQQPQGQAACPL